MHRPTEARLSGPRRRRGCDSTREWAHSITHPCRCVRTASNAHVGVVARRCVSSERGGASVPWRQSRRANPKLVEGACRTPYILPPLHSYICIVTVALARHSCAPARLTARAHFAWPISISIRNTTAARAPSAAAVRKKATNGLPTTSACDAMWPTMLAICQRQSC